MLWSPPPPISPDLWDARARYLLSAPYRPAPGGAQPHGAALALLCGLRGVFGLDERRVSFRINPARSELLARRGSYVAKPGEVDSGEVEIAWDVAADLDALCRCLPVWQQGAALRLEYVIALLSAVHEHFHALSPHGSNPGAPMDRLTPIGIEGYSTCYAHETRDSPGRFIEEGIVDYWAQQTVGRWLFGGTLPGPVRHAWATYRRQVEGIRWFEDGFGIKALLDVWSHTTGNSRAQRMERHLARWLKELLTARGVNRGVVRAWTRRWEGGIWEMFFLATCSSMKDRPEELLACLNRCFDLPIRG
jgi:hypothetical protein